MWYVFNPTFVLQGVVDETLSEEINHRYTQSDDITLTIPYHQDYIAVLQKGYILNRGDNKGYRIQTVDIREDEQTIWVQGYGLESLLSQRVVPFPLSFNNDTESICYTLLDQNFVNPNNPNRKMNGLVISPLMNKGNIHQTTFYKENVYTIISELCKSDGLGYTIHFLPHTQKMVFEVLEGKNRTVLQSANVPIGWSSKRGETHSETITSSILNYKNVIYLESGDTSPIREEVGSASGFERFELFSEANDIKQELEDEQAVSLTTTEVRNLLIQRGKLELYRNHLQEDYQFILSEDLPQTFRKDFFVGDLVSVIHEKYRIVKHSRITTVKELIIQGKSQFQLTFDE